MPDNRGSDKKISQHTERLAGLFNFDVGEDNSKAMDMRSRIVNRDMLRALIYYGSINEAYKSDGAKNIKDFVERLLIAFEGRGRMEAVDVLRQNFPKKIEVEKGHEGGIEDEPE